MSTKETTKPEKETQPEEMEIEEDEETKKLRLEKETTASVIAGKLQTCLFSFYYQPNYIYKTVVRFFNYDCYHNYDLLLLVFYLSV